MRLYECLHHLVDGFAPMSEQSSTELLSSSTNEYMKSIKRLNDVKLAKEENSLIEGMLEDATISDKEKEALLLKLKNVPKVSLIDKIIEIADTWWARYLIAALFIWIKPKVQEYINPAPKLDQVDDEFDD